MEHQNSGLAEINLIISESVPSQESHIVFRNVSLTDSFIAHATSSSFSSPSSSSNNRVTSALTRKPCLFSSLLDWSSNCENHNEVSSSALQSEARLFFGIRLSSLPTTVCITHGHVGFLPLEYVRVLPEYTCTTHYRDQDVRVVHVFEDCNFLFPNQYARTRASRPLQQLVNGDYRSNNMCNRCYASLAGLATYMYRDNPYCSPYCRYAAHVAHCLHDRMMKY